MSTMKKFFKYALWLVLGFILVSILSAGFVAKSFKNFQNYKIAMESPKIEITESKRTNINGYIIGKVTNNTSAVMNNKYIRISFFDNRNVFVGSDYVEISNLHEGKTADFVTHYKHANVEGYVVDITDTILEEEPNVVIVLHNDVEKLVAMVSLGVLFVSLLGFLPL